MLAGPIQDSGGRKLSEAGLQPGGFLKFLVLHLLQVWLIVRCGRDPLSQGQETPWSRVSHQLPLGLSWMRKPRQEGACAGGHS